MKTIVITPTMHFFTSCVALLLAWQVSIYGAAQGYPLLGPAVVAVLLGVSSFAWTSPARQLRFICLCGLLGTAYESATIAAGLYLPTGGLSSRFLCPLWITALWVQIGIFIVSLEWEVAKRHPLALFAGIVAATVGYILSAYLGGIRPMFSQIVLIPYWALSWAMILPILLWMARTQLTQSGDRNH